MSTRVLDAGGTLTSVEASRTASVMIAAAAVMSCLLKIMLLQCSSQSQAVGFRLLFFEPAGPGVYYAPTVIVFSSRFVAVPTQLSFHCGFLISKVKIQSRSKEVMKPTMEAELSRNNHKSINFDQFDQFDQLKVCGSSHSAQLPLWMLKTILMIWARLVSLEPTSSSLGARVAWLAD